MTPSKEAIETAILARADAGCIDPNCAGCIKDMFEAAYAIDVEPLEALVRELEAQLGDEIAESDKEYDRLQAEVERLNRKIDDFNAVLIARVASERVLCQQLAELRAENERLNLLIDQLAAGNTTKRELQLERQLKTLQGDTLHPENMCERCGGRNITWHTDDDLWNKYSNGTSVLCPICFAKACEDQGIGGSWRLTQERYDQQRTVIDGLVEALEFYAAPETYFAIGFFADRPCGEFIHDFEETELEVKPGKRARTALEDILNKQIK